MQLLKRIAALALGLVLLSGPALAFTQVVGTGTGGAISNVTWAGSTTVDTITTAALNTGDLVLLNVTNSATGSATLNCPGDGVNTWTAADAGATINGAATRWFYSILTSAITGGTHLNCTSSVSGSVTAQALAFRPQGTPAFDVAATPHQSGSGDATVGPTASVACPNNNPGCGVCVGSAVWHSQATTSITASGYTNVGSGSAWYAVGFKIKNADTAAETYSAHNTNNSNHAEVLDCFKDTYTVAAGGAPPQSLIGVGP